MRLNDDELGWGWGATPIRKVCDHEFTCCIECVQDWALDYEVAWHRTVGGRAMHQAILDRYATDSSYERVRGVPDPVMTRTA